MKLNKVRINGVVGLYVRKSEITSFVFDGDTITNNSVTDEFDGGSIINDASDTLDFGQITDE